jgi:hypothetical protein
MRGMPDVGCPMLHCIAFPIGDTWIIFLTAMDAKVAQRNTVDLAEIIAFGFWNILHFQILKSIFQKLFLPLWTRRLS